MAVMLALDIAGQAPILDSEALASFCHQETSLQIY